MSLLHILHPWRKIKCYKAVALCLSFVLLWGLDMGNDGVGWWHCTSRYSALRGSPQEKKGKKGVPKSNLGFFHPSGFGCPRPADSSNPQCPRVVDWGHLCHQTSAVTGSHRFGLLVVWGRCSPASCPTASTNQGLSAHQLTTTK